MMIPNNVGLGAACPEGSRNVNGRCECYPGRVWLADGSKCVSPQSPAYTGAISFAEAVAGHTSDTFGQQPLTDAARRTIEAAGHTIDCKIDYENWDASPAGGEPARVCSIDGGEYKHAAYMINLNPYNALVDAGNVQGSVQQLVQQGGGSFVSGSPTGVRTSSMQAEQGFSTPFELDSVADIAGGELIGGIPNWALLAAAGAAAFFVMKK